MNDFFSRQENARRQTGRLLFLFGLAVMGVACAVYLLAAAIRAWALYKERVPAEFWQPKLFLWTTGCTLFCIAAASFWKMRELRNGGAGIASALGGKLIPTNTENPQERMLRNVVEEMAIASGIPVPAIYLLERELGINAFAAGHSIKDAVICVTRGAIELLTRDELQGVIAHEFSHILNGDVLLNIRLLGWLDGIQVVGRIGVEMVDGSRNINARGAALFYAVALALFVIGYVGYFFGQLIKSAVSRQREYLGDASAVQFTRNPGGLAGALKKIGGLSVGSRLTDPRAAELSHMFFGNGLKGAWLHALDTHPPLLDRIRRLEPRFNGAYPVVTPLPPLPAPEQPAYVQKRAAKPPEQEHELSGAALATMLNTVGEPLQQHLDLVRRMLADLPPSVVAATRDPFGACAVVYGLLLDIDETVKARQIQLVEAHDSSSAAGELRRLAAEVQSLSPQVRLPLLDLSLPALRALTAEQYQRLKKTTDALAAADGRTNLFEFTLRHLMLRHLEPRFTPSPSRTAQVYGIRGVQKECSRVLSTLARVGHRNEEEAAAAFAKGLLLLQEQKAEFTFLPAADCGAAPLGKAFEALDNASPLIKRRLLAACLECMVHDNIVKLEEVELFRAISDAIGCPVPPWLGKPSQVSTSPN